MKPRINKTGKAIVYSILITQAVVQLILFIFFRNKDASTRTDYILNSFIFSIIGLVFGIILCIAFEGEDREGECYFSGQFLSFLILLGLYLDRDTPEKERAKKFINARDSYLPIYQDTNTLNVYLKPTQIAIATLETKFDDPHGFLLTNNITSHRDTVVSGSITHIYTIYAFYDVPEKDSLFSKITVFNNRARIEKFNADVRIDEEIKWISQLNNSITE